jgi:hypothetical protein
VPDSIRLFTYLGKHVMATGCALRAESWGGGHAERYTTPSSPDGDAIPGHGVPHLRPTDSGIVSPVRRSLPSWCDEVTVQWSSTRQTRTSAVESVRNEHSVRSLDRRNDGCLMTTSRAAIPRATLKVIADRGCHGKPMSMVAGDAQVGAGSSYRCCGGKEGVVHRLYLEMKRKIGRAFRASYSEELSPRECLRALRLTMLDLLSAPPLRAHPPRAVRQFPLCEPRVE